MQADPVRRPVSVDAGSTFDRREGFELPDCCSSAVEWCDIRRQGDALWVWRRSEPLRKP